jgi:hypothetical protein
LTIVAEPILPAEGMDPANGAMLIQLLNSRIVGKRTLLPEFEPDIVLTQPHTSGVDETCLPFGDRRRWQHSVARYGRITLHWMAQLMAFSKQPGLGAIKHLRPVIAPVADGRVSRLHNHLVRVVGMEKVERRARVASFVVDA